MVSGEAIQGTSKDRSSNLRSDANILKAVLLSNSFGAIILSQQIAATVWFWSTSVYDQLVAQGNGENAASWLGGGLVFLLVTAILQWRVMKQDASWQNRLLFCIQAASAGGNFVALLVFIVRRWEWSPIDTYCTCVVIACCIISAFVYRRAAHRKDWIRTMFVAGIAMAVLAVSLRAMPRVFQGMTLHINNPMSMATLLSGGYIAVVRMAAVGVMHWRMQSLTSRICWYVELFGNVGSQVVLTICWIAVVAIC